MATPGTAGDTEGFGTLPEPRQRYLARVLGDGFERGYRTAADLLASFPPSALVESLGDTDELRVRLLVEATGAHPRIALKKSLASAAEDLELALSEGTTTPARVLELYPPAELVRRLPAPGLWGLAVGDSLFAGDRHADPARQARALDRLHVLVEVALDERLVTLDDVGDAVGFEAIADALPVPELRAVVLHSLRLGRSGAPLREAGLLEVVPLRQLLAHLPLARVFEELVLRRIAGPAGFVSGEAEVRGGPGAAPDGGPGPALPARAPAAVVALASLPAPALPPRLPAADEGEVDALLAASAPAGSGVGTAAVAPPPVVAPRVDESEPGRAAVIERLRAFERLPPRYLELPTALLLSIEGMYADLWSIGEDEDREVAIRDAFPNEAQLRIAMLALIELLDPGVGTADPIIRDAESSGLVKLVLFEERRRRDSQAPRRSTAPLESPARARRSAPPPLPRSATPPPLPVATGARPSSLPPPLPGQPPLRRDR